MHFKIGWAYNWREICVKIFECATGNIRVLARNSSITLKMPSSNTTAINYIRTEIQ